MNKKHTISRKNVYSILVAVLGIVCLCCVLKFRNHIGTKVSEPHGETVSSEPVSEEMLTIQEFTPQYSFLEAVGVRILQANEEMTAGMYLTILDPEFREIAASSTLLNMMPEGECYYFLLNLSVEAGEKYYMMLQCRNVQGEYPCLAGVDSGNRSAENGYYTVDSEIIPDRSLAVTYRYQVPVSRKVLLGWMLLIICLTATGIFVIRRFLITGEKDSVYPVDAELFRRFISFCKKHKFWILWGTIAGFLAAYVSLIFNQNIWTDEAYTLEVLRECRTVPEVFRYTANGANPPLYYAILLPFSNLFGLNLQVCKFLSIVPMILAMILGATYIRKHFGARTGFLYILFLGCIPMTMEYAVQVRMYSWATFFITVCALAAVDAYRTGRIRSYVIMGFAGTACAYTQYFTFASALWVYGILFLFLLFARREHKGREQLKFWIMCLASIILYIPWFPHLYQQTSAVSESYWIPPMTGQVIGSYMDELFRTSLPGTERMFQILFVITLVMAGFRLRRAVQNKDTGERERLVIGFLGLGIMVLTLLTGIILSLLIRPLFVLRYALPCIGLLSLFWAYILSDCRDGVYVLLTLFLLSVGVVEYRDTRAEEYDSTTVHEFIAFMDQNLGEDDLVMYNYDTFDFIYKCYFEENEIVSVNGFDWAREFDDIWFIDTSYYPDPTPEQIEKYGLQISYIANYSIEHNKFSLYRIRK